MSFFFWLSFQIDDYLSAPRGPYSRIIPFLYRVSAHASLFCTIVDVYHLDVAVTVAVTVMYVSPEEVGLTLTLLLATH